MKVGGQILWNVTPICETSQIYYLMGRRPMKDVLGNHFKDRLFPFGSLVEYHPIIAKGQSRIHQVGKKVLPGLFLGYALLKKTQCERGVFSQTRRRIYLSNRRWTNQTPWRRSRPENIHLDTAATSSRRKSP